VIVAAMIGYYVFAIGLLVLVGYITGRQNARQFKARADEMIANLERFHTPLEQPDEPPAVSEAFGMTPVACKTHLKVALGLPNGARPELTTSYLDRLYELLNRLNIQTTGVGVTLEALRRESPTQQVNGS